MCTCPGRAEGVLTAVNQRLVSQKRAHPIYNLSMVLFRDRLAGSDFGWLTPMVLCPQCCYTKTEFKGNAGTINPDLFGREVLIQFWALSSRHLRAIFGLFFCQVPRCEPSIPRGLPSKQLFCEDGHFSMREFDPVTASLFTQKSVDHFGANTC